MAEERFVGQRETLPEDRDLAPRYVIVYVAPEPIGAIRIPRTHARSFESLDDLVTFAGQMGIAESDLIGAWNLGAPLQLRRSAIEVVEPKTVHQWAKPE
jgi:hypothetical protein